MNNAHRILLSIALALPIGCSEMNATPSPPKDDDRTTDKVITFDGLIVANDATELRAPQNEFRLGSWNSNSSWIELSKLTKDGAEVKKGDVVGRFRFRSEDDVTRMLRTTISNVEAERDKSLVSDVDARSKLVADVKKGEIDAASAALDLRRGSTISERDRARYEITKQLAEFNSDANSKYLSAQNRARTAEQDFHQRTVARAHADIDRLKMYKERYVVKAPHDGVVRHAYYRRRRRKVQKGDGMPSGMHFASVSRGKSVSVEVYFPENQYKLAHSAKSLIVKSPTSDTSHVARVTEVVDFPQTLGFVKEDSRIPNAQTRVYIVKAVFDEMPSDMTSGLEVKVSLP